ncbi:MAG: LiaI-LiaF-like domain-containing protein [Dehalococcoidia bacterium]|nr:hypothetical protein [Chloroflexota bacterium]MBT9160184.1 hypothetical protein [Chloroflexota bacterium]MBT9162447.1 hypothetical protein [Chloroflexota bacterium]
MGEGKPSRKHYVSIWGIILVFVGAVLLLQNFDVLPWGLWGTLWRFWPVLLIIIGLNMVVGRHKPWLVAIIILAVLGACLGLAVWQYRSPLSMEATSTYSELRGDRPSALGW